MRLRGLIVMTVILAGLIGFYFWDTRRVEEKKHQEELSKKLFTMTAADLQEITIERPVKTGAESAAETEEESGSSGEEEGEQAESGEEWETIRFARENDTWMLVEPLRTKADPDFMRRFTEDLTSPQIERRLPRPDDLSKYGLDPPRFKVRLTDKEKTTQELLVGEKSPIGYQMYAMLSDADEVVMMRALLETELGKKVEDYRDRAVIDVELDELRKVRITYGERSIELLRRDEEWFIAGEPELRGDRMRIEDLITQLQTDRVVRFVDEQPEDLAQYGLDQPRASISFWIGDDMARKELLFGAEDELGNVYARRGEYPNVFTVKRGAFEDLDKEVSDLRDHRVVRFDRDAITEVRIETDEQTIFLRKQDPEGWTMIEPAGQPVAQSEVSSFLSDLDYLRCIDFLDAPPETMRPFSRIELRAGTVADQGEEEGEESEEEAAGAESEAEAPVVVTLYGPKDENEHWVVTASNNVGAMTLSADDGEKLIVKPFDFRDKVLSDYTRRTLRRLEITRGDEHYLIEGDGEDFEGTGPDEKTELDEQRLDDLIWSFDYVKMRDIAAESPDDLTPYGLDPPTARVTVRKDDDSEYTLLIGKRIPETGGWYVKREDRPEVGMVDSAAFGEFFPEEEPAGSTPAPTAETGGDEEVAES
jgi:hypothetical protein